MQYSIDTISRKLVNRRRLASFAAVFALLFVVVQSAELTHVHDDYLQQADCEICLKFGSDDEGIVSSQIRLATESTSHSPLIQVESAPLAAVITANPRAPPIA